jgi:hypothetical protein
MATWMWKYYIDIVITILTIRTHTHLVIRSRDIADGAATGYGLDDRGVGVRVPVGEEFSLLHVVQTGSGAHPACYPMGTGGSFPRSKAAGE